MAANALGAWELPEELRMMQDTMARFMKNEVKPVEDQLPHDAVGTPEHLLAPLRAKACKCSSAALADLKPSSVAISARVGGEPVLAIAD